MLYAELTVDLYEKLADTNSDESFKFSALYIRLRVLKETQVKSPNPFFDSNVLFNTIRKKLNRPIDGLEELAQNWRSLRIEEIKELRSYKRWISLLIYFEDIVGEEYEQFSNWKSLKELLP